MTRANASRRGELFWLPTKLSFKSFIVANHKLICLDKPFGFETCTASHLKPGIKEILEQQLQKKLWAVDQLEIQFSGALLFAENLESAQWLETAILSNSIQRKFCFLTDRSVPGNRFRHITPVAADKPKCETLFEWAGPRGPYQLWWAHATLGVPEQILLHARECKIPVLGDIKNGGTPAIRIFAHSLSLELSENPTESVEAEGIIVDTNAPWWTESSLADDSSDVWREAFENQRRLFQVEESSTLHVPHPTDEKWQLEIMGEIAVFSKFTDVPLSANESKCLIQWATEFGRKAILKTEPNRESSNSKGERQILESGGVPESWTVREADLKFLLKKDQGQSLGLFLDQRGNRDWVLKNSSEKRVLNLFAYTGGFSVAAALGSAIEVTTVDVSAKYLDWAKENFAANDIDPASHRFYAMDTFEFIKFATKKNLKFDLIVCDPPTFGRSKFGVFKIDRDFLSLLEGSLALLNPEGKIVFSTNFQKWNYSQWEKKLALALPNCEISRGPGFSLDFEKNLLERKMKSFLIKKRQ